MNTQFKKGALEMTVLAQLEKEDKYGYQLTEAISQELDIANGTLYLILKRLNDDQYLDTYLQQSSEGPARKYYRLTEKGRQHLSEMKEEWLSFVRKIDKLI